MCVYVIMQCEILQVGLKEENETVFLRVEGGRQRSIVVWLLRARKARGDRGCCFASLMSNNCFPTVAVTQVLDTETWTAGQSYK